VIVPKKAIVAKGAANAMWVVRGGELVILEPPANLESGSCVTAAGSQEP